MKRAIFLIATVILSTAGHITAADRAPDFTLKDLDGQKFTLADALTKGPVLLDFWATWCAPCVEELPQVNRIYNTYKDAGLQVFAISVDNPRSRSQVDPFVSSYGFDFRVLLDPDLEIRKRFGGDITPYTVLIDRDGKVVFDHTGYVPGDEKALEEAVQKLLTPSGDSGTEPVTEE